MTAPMNATVAQLTARSLLGRRRTVVLMLLPLVLLALAVLIRALAGTEASTAAGLLGAFGIAIMMPLLGLIAGTGSIGPEIDEGSIVYLLAKPLNRYTIIITKLAVALAVIGAFGVVPIAVAGLIMTGSLGGLTAAYTVGAIAAGLAYAAVFICLAVITRNAVVVGLIYALIWESLIGGIVPGAQALSIQQWSLAVAEQTYGSIASTLGLDAAVEFGTGLVMLVVVTVGATAYAGRRLQTLRLHDDA